MITLVPPNSAWPGMFAAEAAAIRRMMGDRAVRVEHVGSTAIPGLAAKPVVDIQVSVLSLEPMSQHAIPLGHIGYVHIPLGSFDLVYPFFQKPAEWPCTHHIHLCVVASEQERNHLVFRDYLRDHPLLAAEYVELKCELAAAHHGNTQESREEYSLAKTEFVTSVLKRALYEGYASRQDDA